MSKAAVLIALLGLASSASALKCLDFEAKLDAVIEEKCADKTDPIEKYKCGVDQFGTTEVECPEGLLDEDDIPYVYVCAAFQYKLYKEGEDEPALEITVPADECYQERDCAGNFEDDDFGEKATAWHVEGYQLALKHTCCTGDNCNAPSTGALVVDATSGVAGGEPSSSATPGVAGEEPSSAGEEPSSSAFGATAAALVAAMALVSVALF